jgi:hypothetical protein
VNREQLAHILRAASTIVDDPNILVIGSQSVLATLDEDELPDAATASMEVDLAYFDDPTEDKADAVDGAIGELSPFHEMNGVYAQGVSVRNAVLPEGWRGRVVPWSNHSTGRALAVFLEPHDCVVSKLVAYRQGLRIRGGHARVRSDRPNDPCPAHRLIARAPGSAGTEEAAFMVEGLGRPTPTRRA